MVMVFAVVVTGISLRMIYVCNVYAMYYKNSVEKPDRILLFYFIFMNDLKVFQNTFKLCY